MRNQSSMPQAEKQAGPEPAIPASRADRAGILWFVIQVALAVLFLASDAAPRLAYLAEAREVLAADKSTGTPAASPANAVGVVTRDTILPATAIDARWWVMHTANNMEAWRWRARATAIDNHPAGREIHWSSALPWLLEGMARLGGGLGGKSPQDMLELTPLFAGPVMFGMLGALVAGIVVRGFGWKLAGFMILMLATSFPVLEMFRAGEADHHGLAMMFALGNVLCLLVGMVKSIGLPDGTDAATCPRAGRWFIAAGLLGAGGMWISAATMIPVLAACGLGALGSAACARLTGRESPVNPAMWWHWGVAGCLGSLAFYALEYLPAHAGWRLEVNHPLHALAWLSTAAVLQRGCRWLSGAGPLADGWVGWAALATGIAGALLPVGAIAIHGSTVFKLADPWLLAIHRDYIREFAPLWQALRADGGAGLWFDYFAWPAFAMAGLVVLLFKSNPGTCRRWLPAVVLVFTVAILVQGMALAQIRWSGLALGMWSACVASLLGVSRLTGMFANARGGIKAGLGALAAIALLAHPISAIPAMHDAAGEGHGIPRNLVPAILLRDISHRIARSSPGIQPVVLTDPTSATDIAYFGGARVLGTFYWENLEGLKRTSMIFAAPTEEMARQLMREAGVTHVVLPTWDAFSDVKAHIALMKLDGFIPEEQSGSFWQRVAAGGPWPDWLRPFYHGIPPEFGASGQRILFFEVRPEQSAVEAAMYRGVYHAEAGALADARDCFRDVLAKEPGNAAAAEWLAGVTEIMETMNSQHTEDQ